MKNLVSFITEQMINELNSRTMMAAYYKQVGKNHGLVDNRARRFKKYAKQKKDAEGGAINHILATYVPGKPYTDNSIKVDAYDRRQKDDDYNAYNGNTIRAYVPKGKVFVINTNRLVHSMDHKKEHWAIVDIDMLYNIVFFELYYNYEHGKFYDHERKRNKLYEDKTFNTYVMRAADRLMHHDSEELENGYDAEWYGFDNWLDAIAFVYKQEIGTDIDFASLVGKDEKEIRQILPAKFWDSLYYEEIAGNNDAAYAAEILAGDEAYALCDYLDTPTQAMHEKALRNAIYTSWDNKPDW